MKTIILAGNGSTENGWEPIKSAISTNYPNYNLNPIDPNIIFANLIFQLRFLTKFENQKMFEERKTKYYNLKDSISFELKESQKNKTIRLRPEYIEICRKYSSEIVGIVDLNWDTLKEDLLLEMKLDRKIELLKFHGEINNSSNLLLPSEVTEEDFRESNKFHQEMNKNALRLIENAERLILFGCSLSVLDIELHFVLTDGFHGTENPKELLVCDPNFDDIKNLLEFYFPNFKGKIKKTIT